MPQSTVDHTIRFMGYIVKPLRLLTLDSVLSLQRRLLVEERTMLLRYRGTDDTLLRERNPLANRLWRMGYIVKLQRTLTLDSVLSF